MPSSGERCGHTARSFLVWICWPAGALLFGHSGFFPQSKVMHVWLIGDSELAAAANGCVSLCVSPIMAVKDVHCFSAFGMGFSTLSPWTGEAAKNKGGQEVYIDVYCPKASDSVSIKAEPASFFCRTCFAKALVRQSHWWNHLNQLNVDGSTIVV